MKKIILFALIATAVSGCCKKDEVQPVKINEEGTYEKQVADLIQKADPGLYDQVYNDEQRAVSFDVKFIPGSFVILDGDVGSGTCFPTNSVCMIIITAAIDNDIVIGPTPIGNNVNLRFSSSTEATIIMNNPQLSVVKNVTEVSTSTASNGWIKWGYKRL